MCRICRERCDLFALLSLWKPSALRSRYRFIIQYQEEMLKTENSIELFTRTSPREGTPKEWRHGFQNVIE